MTKKCFMYCVFLIVSILFMTSCSVADDTEQEVFNHADVITNADITAEENTTEENTTECATTEEITIALSSSCDIVLACGTSETGDFYEVVAVEHEDYTGTEIKVGVIKNNQWLIELTNNNPIIGDNGFLWDVYTVEDIREQQIRDIYYIGNSCFCICIPRLYDDDDLVVWDVEKDLTFEQSGCGLVIYEGFTNEEGLFVVADGSGGFLLDTNTMTRRELADPVQKMIDSESWISSVVYTPYSEGLYGITSYHTKYNGGGYEGFYDVDGNMVIDLSQYKFDNYDFAFKNGLCEMVIINDQNSYYKITIDKTGNVINSEKIR